MLHLDDLERIELPRRRCSTLLPPTGRSFDGRAAAPARDDALQPVGMGRAARPTLDERLRVLWANPARRERCSISRCPPGPHPTRHQPRSPGGDLPLHLHARYSLAELLAAFGVPKPSTSRGAGVKWIPDEQADVFWFNLRKTEKHFSPTTMYADRAISPTLFQWESQNSLPSREPAPVSATSTTGPGSSVHLFFRETKEADGDLGAPPTSTPVQPPTSATPATARCASSGSSTTNSQPTSSTRPGRNRLRGSPLGEPTTVQTSFSIESSDAPCRSRPTPNSNVPGQLEAIESFTRAAEDLGAPEFLDATPSPGIGPAPFPAALERQPGTDEPVVVAALLAVVTVHFVARNETHRLVYRIVLILFHACLYPALGS